MKERSEIKVPAKSQERTAWQTPTLTRVGAFGEIIATGGSKNGESGVNMMT